MAGSSYTSRPSSHESTATIPGLSLTLPSADAALTDMSLYRDGAIMRSLLDRIGSVATRPWRIMEVCGGQTFTLSRYRLEEMLPEGISMIHGPGCPVCVTPQSVIDSAIRLARRHDVILCSFGDMLRVPGTVGSLLRAKSEGCDVRIFYSPLDALKIAAANPEKEVVFFAIGFETTMPAYAVMAQKAYRAAVKNLSLLTSLFTVPAAVTAVTQDPASRVDALLAAGHVCAVTGLDDYYRLSDSLKLPIVVTGFEPVDMLLGILRAVEMLEKGKTGVTNAYGRTVRPEGSVKAKAAVEEVFEPCDTAWRGMGVLPKSGMKLREKYKHFDSCRRFDISHSYCSSPGGCISHLIMKGVAVPADCPAFGHECTPEAPVGAPMVSSEGVCAAHYRYLR